VAGPERAGQPTERKVAELFSGHSEHTLDAKGRVIVPAKYRSFFAEGAHLGVGTNRYLALWTRASYERQANAWLEKMESGDEGVEEEAHYWASNIEDVSVDASTGRLLIPPYMRTHAQLETGQPVLLSGALSHIAVWNPTLYAARIEEKAASKFTKDRA
jgi:MraZ protein